MNKRNELHWVLGATVDKTRKPEPKSLEDHVWELDAIIDPLTPPIKPACENE